jgi:predicted heme/steroid binding protein
VSQGKCLVAVDSNVFDMTSAVAWDSSGHGSYGHLCGAFVDSSDSRFPSSHLDANNYETYFGKYFYSVLCQENLCGNGQVDAGENCSNCPEDVQCGSGELCCNASCQVIECFNDSECNDFNPDTVDSCNNPGSCNAFCSNTLEFTCYSKTKFNALVASGKCLVIVGSKIYDMSSALSWDSSGHYQHLCGSTINPNDSSMPSTHKSNPSKYFNKYYLTDLCPEFECGNQNCSGNEICCNNSCIEPVCSSNADCDDSDSCTVDSCKNPNSCNAFCENTPLTDCGTQTLSLKILAPNTVVEGQAFTVLVQDQDNSLIEKATLSYGTQNVLTDKNGSAELTAEIDANKITATKNGYREAVFLITVTPTEKPTEKRLVLSIQSELIEGEPFKVIVRDSQGFIVPNARVRYGSEVKLTNEEGTAVFQAKKDTSIISVEKKGFSSDVRVSLPKKKVIALSQDFTTQVIALSQLIGAFMLTIFSIEVLMVKK